MAACLREDGIGPDHSLKFDLGTGLIARAKIRQPVSEEFYQKPPTAVDDRSFLTPRGDPGDGGGRTRSGTGVERAGVRARG